MTVDALIDQGVANALGRLATMTLPSPAYAVALQSADPEGLNADTIMVGLERDRIAALDSPDEDIVLAIWNAYDFAIEAGEDTGSRLSEDATFL